MRGVVVDAAHRAVLRPIGEALAKLAGEDGAPQPEEVRVRIGRTWYALAACRGEAHANPFIDHCGRCAPFWGVVVQVLP